MVKKHEDLLKEDISLNIQNIKKELEELRSENKNKNENKIEEKKEIVNKEIVNKEIISKEVEQSAPINKEVENKENANKEIEVNLADKKPKKPKKPKKDIPVSVTPKEEVAKDAGEEKVTKKVSVEKEEKMYVIPLGGLEEVGKNCTVVQYRDEIIIMDCGVMFPDENLPGIDLVIPDFSYLENNKDKIKGLFITHGHEDHIGAIPYLYQKIDKSVPLYGGKLTLGLVKAKFEGLNYRSDLPKGKEVKGRTKVKVGKYFTVEFIRVTHSIADAYAIAVTTPAGTILNTGDFKIDLTPVDGRSFDFARLSQLGEHGVDLLLADSTNSELEGFTPSEKTVGESFRTEFLRAKGRIIVAAFASHVHRLQQIVNIAEANGRKIAIDGRSMVRVFEIATELGYLKVPANLIVPLYEIDKMPANKAVVLCTGTQGEPLAALSRIAKGMHKHIKIKKGDTVIISATPIPGNEKAVSNNINNLAKENAEVVFKKVAGIHVSGHGSAEEQKLMLNLVKPKNFMPIHGEYRMLKAHKQSAMETGMKEENIVIAVNGQKVEVTKSKVTISGKVSAGVTLVDGLGVGDIGNTVIKDRQQLSQDGIVVINFTLSKENGKILAGPEIVTKGFIYGKEMDEFLREGIESIKPLLEKYEKNGKSDVVGLRNGIRDLAAKFFYSKIKRNPIIIPMIMEV